MVKEQKLPLMDKSMSGNTRMGNEMVKGHSLSLMEESLLGNSRMEKSGMDKEQKLYLMEVSM